MFEELGNLMVGWKKNRIGQIVVYSHGYVSSECFKADAIMNNHGMLQINRIYHPGLNKTLTTYRKAAK